MTARTPSGLESGERGSENASLRPTPKSADTEAEPSAAVLTVRAILHAHQRAMTPPDSGWGDMSYERGSYDHLPAFQAAIRAYEEAWKGQ